MSITTVAFIIIATMAALAVLFMLGVHFGFKAPRIAKQGNPSDLGMKYRQIDIAGCNGTKLFGWHILASGKPDTPTALIMHGWGVTAQTMLPLALPLYKAGFNLLLIDARNHGDSSVDGHSSMPKFAEDIESGLDWLKAQPETGKIGLIGHSVGAAAVLLVASRRHDIAALIAISSFAHPERLMRRYLQKLYLPQPLINLTLRYVERVIGHPFDDIAPMNSLCKIKCPVLLVHGDADKTIPVSDMYMIADNCKTHRTQTLVIAGADHDSVDRLEQHSAKLVGFLQESGL